MRKIAIPVSENNKVDGHFGHCKYYNVYTISENNSVIDTQQIASEDGCGCKSNIASVLAGQGVQVMLAGGIGAGAINVLNKWNIDVVRGCTGDVDTLLKQYTDGLIEDSGETCAHTHEDGHECSH